MAEPVKRLLNGFYVGRGLLIALGFAAATAVAENLPDPTRPSGAAYAEENANDAPRGPVLQSVLSSSGRRIAIISGQTVKQGDMIGNSRVHRIRDTEVVLAQGRETQVLKLFPVLEKQPSTPHPAPRSALRH